MIVRDVQNEDFPAIEQIHAQMGMDYSLPDLGHPLFLVRKVAVDDKNVLQAACFLRISTECYLWLDPKLDPQRKMDVMRELQPVVLSEAWNQGIDDVEARIPETVERRFQKRLRELGWTPSRNGWHPWTVRTDARCSASRS